LGWLARMLATLSRALLMSRSILRLPEHSRFAGGRNDLLLAPRYCTVNVGPILLNDFKRQWDDTGTDVLAAVSRVGASGWYVLGDSVRKFEANLEAFLGAGFCTGCASGLDAIELALRALELSPGARVLTTPLSAFATTLAIVRAGGVPVFVDVDASGNLDLELCDALLATRADITAMVPVHLYGHPLALDRLKQLSERHRLHVVEDCAQAIGASYGGQAVGTVGSLAALSFYPTKNLGAMGDGGGGIGIDTSLKSVCASLRNYGQSARYVHDRLGLNSRLDELHAAILGSAFLPRLAHWTQRRREIATRYCSGITHQAVRVLLPPTGGSSVWHLFPVCVAAAQRDAFQAHLEQRGVQTGIHYPKLIPDQAALRAVAYEVHGSLDNARTIAGSQVSLPIHPYLADAEIDYVIRAVNDWQS